jgi:hypothetical protein
MKQSNRIATQRGMTLLGFVIVLMIAGAFAFVAIRLFPVYSEYYSVVSAMRAMQKEPGIAAKSPEEVKGLLFRKFYISYVTTPKISDIKVTKRGGDTLLQVKYEKRGNLLYNLDYIAAFDKSVSLTRPGVDD